MDNSEQNISDEDIDARLARYEEPREDEFENSSRVQLYEHNYKTSEDQYSISNKNKREPNEMCEDFSHPLSSFHKLQDDRDCSMGTGYAGKKQATTGGKLLSAMSKSHLSASELNVFPEEYFNRQQKRAIKQRDPYVDCTYGKINEFPKNYSVSQRNRILIDDNQLTDYLCYRTSSDTHSDGNMLHTSLSPLNKEEFETGYMFSTSEKKNSYPTSDAYNEDLKQKKKISSKPNDDFQSDNKNYKFVSTQRNGARIKNVIRESYPPGDISESKISEYNMIDAMQNSGCIDFNEKRMDRGIFRSQIAGPNKYNSDYSRYSDFKQSHKKQNSSKTNNEQHLHPKEKRTERRNLGNLNSSGYANGLGILYSNHAYSDQNYKSGLSEKSSRMNNNYGISFFKPDNCNIQHLQDENFKQSGEMHSNYHTGFEICDSARSDDDFEINQRHHKDMLSNFKCSMQDASLGDRYTASGSRHPGYENQMKHRPFENKEDNNDVWKRQSAYIEEIHSIPISSDLREITNRRSTANTFTMCDARRIAPIVMKCSIDDSSIRQEVSQITDEEAMFSNKRRCWARVCWSCTNHSHALDVSKDLHSWRDRNAIMNSMKSPQYATKSKKKTFAGYWSSFLKASASRFELWSRTLKKIEGQFGTGVVSYFVFLRWLILLNFVIFILYLLLIILPYSAFALLPHQNIKSAPNTSLLTDEYLQQFPKYENVPFSRKRIGFENVSLNLDLDGDLLSSLGGLLDNYVTDEILDVTVRYSKRNYTGKERYNISLYCEDQYEKLMANHTKGIFSSLQDFLQGTGWLQSTILFLGFYPDRDVSYFGLPYNLPVSFLAVFIVSFFLSLVLMVQYSSHGIQENVLTQKSNYLTFSNILFCSWDYCIEDKKTADIRHKSITCEIKSNLAEEYRKSEVSHWSSEKWMKVYMLRATVNIIVIGALFGCFYLIYKVVNYQLEKQRQNALKDAGIYTLFIQFLPPLVITGLNIVMPIIFYSLVKFEMYNTRTQINMALFRIVFLRLASVFVLVSSLYQQITCEPKDSCRAGISEFCRSPICWETYVGQQLYKLVITDFLVYICMFLAYDLPRDFIVQKCRCKVTEIVGRQVFDIPSQVLSLVYSQTLCWLGLLYSPLLPGISVMKFLIIFYIKKVVVLKHCVPAPVLYKASRSNSIFMTILMISFFVVTMIHGYSLTSIEPSPGCSPFRQYEVMIHAISDSINNWSSQLVKFMTYVFSGFFFIPASILISLVIYYYWTVVAAHKQMTKVLKAQIAVEGRDKQFLLNRLAEAARQTISS